MASKSRVINAELPLQTFEILLHRLDVSPGGLKAPLRAIHLKAGYGAFETLDAADDFVEGGLPQAFNFRHGVGRVPVLLALRQACLSNQHRHGTNHPGFVAVWGDMASRW